MRHLLTSNVDVNALSFIERTYRAAWLYSIGATVDARTAYERCFTTEADRTPETWEAWQAGWVRK